MTQEEKQLQLRDLCSRLPYGVKALTPWKKDGPGPVTLIDVTSSRQVRVFEDWYGIEEIKPYLRPMSSMTEDEQRYIWNKYGPSPLFADFEDVGDVSELFKYCHMNIGDAHLFVDWLNAHHFDYRGLIPKGLALKAPKDMYKQ